MTTTYRSYQGLPPLAGLASFEAAMQPGLTVDESVRRLKRVHYAFRRLHAICTARITAEPIYELKMSFSLHAHLCAEQVSACATRVAEMREPPLGLDLVPDPALAVFFDEILAAPTTVALVVGLYAHAFPSLQTALEQQIEATNPLADQPTVRLCRIALMDLGDINRFGAQAVTALLDAPAQEQLAAWRTLLDKTLAVAGGLDGTQPVADMPLIRQFSATPYVYDPRPQRDERFADPYNMGVNAEAFLYDERYPASAKVLMMYYKRLREIDVPEMMASIITETPDKPWDYYRAMTRQLWDEARHAMMGEVGFVSLGIDWTVVMINFTWSLALNAQLTPLERHGVLYFIEQGLMPKTGKRFEWEVATASQNALAATFQDYDWADEVLHAHIGRHWYVPLFANAAEAKAFGDRAWTKALIDWQQWRADGLTQHRNWWPDLYRAACAQAGTEPDPQVLAFAETYEHARADHQAIIDSKE